MKDAVGRGVHGPPQHLRIAGIAIDHGQPVPGRNPGEVFPPPGREIVDDGDFVACAQQRTDEMTADETRASGDNPRFHGVCLSINRFVLRTRPGNRLIAVS